MLQSKLKSKIIYALFLLGVIGAALVLFNSYKAFKLHKIYTSKERWPDNSRRFHPAMGYEMTPSFSGSVQNKFDIKSHRLGYRIAKHEDDSLALKGGILFTGCSFTYGDEQNAEYTFPFLVGDSLKIPAYNFGVCGYSYAQMILQLRELERNNILDTLSPKYLVLGAGSWLTDRSTSPFYPSSHLQLGYSYIGKENNVLQIKQPSEFYSIKHLYKMKDVYRQEGNINDLSFGRFYAMSDLVPRTFLANYFMNRWEAEVKSSELYNYIFSEFQSIASRHHMKLIVLWMTTDENEKLLNMEIVSAAEANHVILIYCPEALKKFRVAKSDYVNKHPGKDTHKAYSNAVIEEIRK